MTRKQEDTGEQPEPWYVRQKDVAKLTGLSASEVRHAIRTGKLKARTYGRRAVLIAPDDIRAWIDAETHDSATVA